MIRKTNRKEVNMPTPILFLLILFAFIFIVFIVSKRPIYEVMGLGLILILFMTGSWGELPTFIHNTFSTSLLYVIFAFIAVSEILSETNVINEIDAGAHTIFLLEVEDTVKINDGKPMTYDYYHKVVKGKTPKTAATFSE